MMNSSQFLRAETITAAAHRAGRNVAIVTAKEKLRDILGAGLSDGPKRGIAFSSEKVDQAKMETHGIDGGTVRAGKRCRHLLECRVPVGDDRRDLYPAGRDQPERPVVRRRPPVVKETAKCIPAAEAVIDRLSCRCSWRAWRAARATTPPAR